MALLVCSGCSTRYASGLERCPHCGLGGGVEEGSRPAGSRLPFLDVACGNEACRVFDVQRRVYLRQAAPGVVELPQFACAVCGYLMGGMSNLDAWSGAAGPEEADMPKVTRHGGASNAAAEREHQLDAPSEGIEMPADGSESPEITGDGTGEALPLADGQEGGEESSPGNSSSTSAEKPETSPETTASGLPKRVPRTGSRSSRGRAGSSTARSTDGSGEADAS